MLVSVHLTCEHASCGHRLLELPRELLHYHVYHHTVCLQLDRVSNGDAASLSHNSCIAEDFAAAVSSFVPAERISRWWLPTASLFHVWCEPLVALNVLSLARCRQFASVQPFLPVESFPWGELANSLPRFDQLAHLLFLRNRIFQPKLAILMQISRWILPVAGELVWSGGVRNEYF